MISKPRLIRTYNKLDDDDDNTILKGNNIKLKNFNLRSTPRNKQISFISELFDFYISESIVYVIKLENDKWYVGQTQSLDTRLKQHFNGSGAMFTQLYQPIELNYSKSTHYPDYLEFIYTLKLMKRFGLDNVRGSCYCSSSSYVGDFKLLNDINNISNFESIFKSIKLILGDF